MSLMDNLFIYEFNFSNSSSYLYFMWLKKKFHINDLFDKINLIKIINFIIYWKNIYALKSQNTSLKNWDYIAKPRIS